MQNHTNKSIKKIAPVAATAFVAAVLVGAFSFPTTTAWAAVTFDEDDGTGFVGKGDVQNAFGWNNKQLQSNAGGVSFSFEGERKANQDCEKTITTGPPSNPETQTITNTQKRGQSIDSDVTYDPRIKTQITGFTFTGYSGDAEWEGQTPQCPTGWTSVGDVYYTDEEGHLVVHYGGSDVNLT